MENRNILTSSVLDFFTIGKAFDFKAFLVLERFYCENGISLTT